MIVQPKTLNRWHRLGFRNSGATNPSPDGYTTYTSMIIQALEMIGEILHIENITRTLLGILTNSIYTILLILVGYSIAQGQDTEGTSDHPKISRYEGSIIDGYEVQDFNEYLLPLGPVIKDADGNRVPSLGEALEGRITRILYRGPEGRSTLEIFRNYQSAFENAGFETLFNCSSKECGFLFHWHLYKDRAIKNTKTSGNAFDQPNDIRYMSAKIKTNESTIHASLLVAIDTIWTKQPVTLLEI